jgi:hypothetical protein
VLQGAINAPAPTFLPCGYSSIALLFLTVPLVDAQEFRGRIQGAVLDPTSALVPGASLVLVNAGTGVYVDPGTYILTAELSGFKKWIQQNIIVQQRGDVTVDIQMETGGVTESTSTLRMALPASFQ